MWKKKRPIKLQYFYHVYEDCKQPWYFIFLKQSLQQTEHIDQNCWAEKRRVLDIVFLPIYVFKISVTYLITCSFCFWSNVILWFSKIRKNLLNYDVQSTIDWTILYLFIKCCFLFFWSTSLNIYHQTFRTIHSEDNIEYLSSNQTFGTISSEDLRDDSR